LLTGFADSATGFSDNGSAAGMPDWFYFQRFSECVSPGCYFRNLFYRVVFLPQFDRQLSFLLLCRGRQFASIFNIHSSIIHELIYCRVNSRPFLLHIPSGHRHQTSAGHGQAWPEFKVIANKATKTLATPVPIPIFNEGFSAIRAVDFYFLSSGCPYVS